MIQLQGVSKVFPDGTVAVKEVSIEVKEGEFCVLLGPSGCGKTTTLKMINRLIPMTSGKIYVNGIDINTVDENELRRNIGYAIQDIGLFPHMTVAENIQTVPALKGWAKNKQREKTRELLELVRMEPDMFMDRYPAELSGGQRQRVGVARALGADPPILLMDEPFGAIDPITRVDLQNEFLKIQQKIRKTVVFVTHDIYEAIKMGDKIALMNEGKLVQYDTPAALLYRPEDEFVENFVGVDRALKGLQLIRVKEVMTKDSLPLVKADAKAAVAEEEMKEKDLERLLVVDEQGKFLGWVSRAESRKGEVVRNLMVPSTVTTTPNMVLNEALSLMLSSEHMSLPVVDEEDNTLAGLLTFSDIQKRLSEAHGGEQ